MSIANCVDIGKLKHIHAKKCNFKVILMSSNIHAPVLEFIKFIVRKQ